MIRYTGKQKHLEPYRLATKMMALVMVAELVAVLVLGFIIIFLIGFLG